MSHLIPIDATRSSPGRFVPADVAEAAGAGRDA